MGVCRPGAFVDPDGGPCGLWGRLARYGACDCRHGIWRRLLAARCTAGEFAGGRQSRRPEWCRLAWRRRNGAAYWRHGSWRRGSWRHGVPPGDCPAAEAGGGVCGAHLMPRHIHGHPADPPYRLSYSRAPSRTPSGIGLLAFHSQWHSRLAERIFSVLSRQRSPWPPAKLARGGSNDGRNRWQRKDRLRNRNVAK